MLKIQFTAELPDLSAFAADENLHPAIDLIQQWYAGAQTFTFLSSGSTGIPKEITLTRELLTASAYRTIKLFDIQTSDTLLLALNTSFMGGMMMVVRSAVAQSTLLYISPQQLIAVWPQLPVIKLASLVPAQVASLLKDKKHDPFSSIQNLLIGGGPMSEVLQQQLVALKSSCRFYHTYGMTETASHVALREITAQHTPYEALEGFYFSQDERACLIIHLSSDATFRLVTNDVVQLYSNTSFKWIGRADWVVNSGGIKYSLEQAEEYVASFFHARHQQKPFTSYKMSDDKWGEKWVLIVEGTLSLQETEELKNYCKQHAGKYIYPKDIYVVKKLVYLSSGKVDRINSFKEATILSI